MLSFTAFIGFLLVAVALGGGAYASYMNIKNARGPRERRFVARACAVGWTLVLSMLLMVYFLPSPYRYAVVVLYFLIMPPLIYRWALTHQMLRLIDERERSATT